MLHSFLWATTLFRSGKDFIFVSKTQNYTYDKLFYDMKNRVLSFYHFRADYGHSNLPSYLTRIKHAIHEVFLP
jgi:hypothetical protein